MTTDKELTMGAGRTLFKQGEKGGDLYFIKSGLVVLTVRDEATGAEATVAELGPRSVIGTMSFLEGDPRSATATAKTEVSYVLISQLQRDRLLQTVPPWFRALVKDLSASMRRLNESFIKMKADLEKNQKKAESKGSQKDALEKELADLKAASAKASSEFRDKEAAMKKQITELEAKLAAATAAVKK